MRPPAQLDDFQELGELNRLFLGFLKERAAQNRDCLGLAAPAARLLRGASSEMLDSAASVPRALFRFELDAAGASTMESEQEVTEHVGYALRLTLLHSAWNLSRRSGYRARLLLGLTPQQVRMLRITALSRLPALAAADGLLACAFRGSAWLWRGLLTETRPEMKRYLLLIVLQPQVPPAVLGRLARRHAGA